MKIPTNEIPKPLYKPAGPSYLNVFLIQSAKPVNYLSPVFPDLTSAANLVLQKSNG